MKDCLTSSVPGRVATWRTQLLVDLIKCLDELFVLERVILTTLRGYSSRIGDWSEPTHTTSQQYAIAVEKHTNRFNFHFYHNRDLVKESSASVLRTCLFDCL